MSFSSTTLLFAARQILSYGGLLMIPIGMFGSSMVLIIFSQRPLNENPCSTYIRTNALLSFLFLPSYYLTNIVTSGFQINWLSSSTPICKSLMSYGAFTVTSVFVINCFISFDRYVISSRSARIRSMSSKKIARVLVLMGLFIAWCLLGVPVAILFENVPLGPNGPYICTSRSNTFLMFAAFIYYPILEGILPLVLAICFWFLTRKQIRSLNNQEFVRRSDKQITRMYLFQIMASAVASVPFATINLHRALTVGMTRTRDEENIVLSVCVIAIWLFYVQYCTDFYIYLITSKELRAQAAKVLCIWREYRNNRVAVVQTLTLTLPKGYKANRTKNFVGKT